MNKNKVQVVIFHTAQNGNRLILLLQMNKRRKLLWQNVTGAVETNESFKQAALRETTEETGLQEDNIIDFKKIDLEFTFTDQWQHSVYEQVFYCEVKNKWEVILDQAEHCSYQWIEEKNIDEKSVHYPSNLEAIRKALILNKKRGCH